MIDINPSLATLRSMRRRTLGFGDCCYHVVSRINERRFYLGDRQKEYFVSLLKRVALFSGVEVLTYCVMDNHFHLLVRVPCMPALSDADLFRRLKILYKPDEYDALCLEFSQYQTAGDDKLMRAFRQRYLKRMYDLSEFVRTLKHRFSLWYNRCNEREGPLWTGRFKSVLVQSSSDEFGRRALTAVAVYIDLNAVRAELVEDAQDYLWCGFYGATRQNEERLKMIRYLVGRSEKHVSTPENDLAEYGKLLQKGLPLRIDRLSSGCILGQRPFVNAVAARRPECFGRAAFNIAEEITALRGSGLHTVRRFCRSVHKVSGYTSSSNSQVPR